jgi:formylglycine-generating enzyme required for sulfatase activity
VTNAEYAAFVRATGYRAPRHWKQDTFSEDLADHPVVWVNWHDALAYVTWLQEQTEQPYRLLTETEWEKAARGTEGRLWPWGNEWDAQKCNTELSGSVGTKPVGQYSPAGDSPYGCADVAGNVWEWCSSLYQPYKRGDGRENLEEGGARVEVRVWRGGSWYSDNPGGIRCAYRSSYDPGGSYHLARSVDSSGFRVARSSRP